MKNGDKVKMSQELKSMLILANNKNHVDEFGDCIGIVEEKGEADDDINVLWQPTNLRYSYSPKMLIKVDIHSYLDKVRNRMIILFTPLTILFALIGYGYITSFFLHQPLFSLFVESYFLIVVWLLLSVITVQWSDNIRSKKKDIREEYKLRHYFNMKNKSSK